MPPTPKAKKDPAVTKLEKEVKELRAFLTEFVGHFKSYSFSSALLREVDDLHARLTAKATEPPKSAE